MPAITPSYKHWLILIALLSILTICNAFILIQSPTTSTCSRRQATTLQAIGKSGGILIKSEDEFEQVALSESLDRPVMVFFTAPWCSPCRLSIPVVKEVNNEYTGQIISIECVTDDFPEIASNAGVVSIPTIQIYYQGQVQDTIVGCVAKKVLSMAVEKVLEDVCEDKDRTNGDDDGGG